MAHAVHPGAAASVNATTASANETRTGGARVPFYRSAQSEARPSQVAEFMRYCESRTGYRFRDPASFHDFSVAEFRTFWRLFASWSQMICEGSPEPVCVGDLCESATFFPCLHLNYVENLLKIASEVEAAQLALTACHPAAPPERLTRRQLRNLVVRGARALERMGVKPGDRIVAVAQNNAEVIVGALAALSIGATFSSASSDMGAAAILSRFQQLSPCILMVNAPAAAHASIAEIVNGLPSLTKVILLDTAAPPEGVGLPNQRIYDLTGAFDDPSLSEGDEPFAWTRFPFNHPLFILFSSGTTGRPKCIVHGAGGTLLEHLKEHRLHGDLKPSDTMFFHTSSAWMMWNWQLSALACGAEIVVYDGPLSGPETLWKVVADQNVSVFGTSPPYLKLCNDSGYSPKSALALPSLRSVMSTGSILFESEYEWFHENVGSLPLQSISGGTDIIGCFVLGHPDLPVYAGESQCRSLGLDVRAALPSGAMAQVGMGDLVCCNPFPSRPIGFFGDEDGALFHKAYFGQNEGVWTHGDVIEFAPEGTARMHGRSDSVLNVNGNRIGPGEIYHILAGLHEIRECMAVEQVTPDGPERSRMVLLVIPSSGHSLTDALRQRIRQELVRQASPAYVPALMAEIEELPVTYSNKRSERAVRDALNGRVSVNAEALRNPACLDVICRQVALEDEREAQALLEADAPADASLPLLPIVQRVWRKVLRHPSAPQDRWNESGGDSLKLLRFVFELEEVLGTELPLDRFRSNMTAEDFAAAVESIRSDPDEAVDAETASKLVFLFPGQMGDAPYLANFRAEIGGDVRFAVIKYPSWREMVDGRLGMEALAAAAERQIARILPEGDIRIIGYSLGGAIASMVAERLAQQGRSLAFMAVLDTDIGRSVLTAEPVREGTLRRTWSRLSRIAKASRNALHGVAAAASVRERVQARLLWQLSNALVHPRCESILVRLRHSDLAFLPTGVRFDLQRWITGALQERAFQAWMKTEPRLRLPGQVVLVRSEESRLLLQHDLGWGDVFDAIDVVDVGGDHIEMMREPAHRALIITSLRSRLAAVLAPRPDDHREAPGDMAGTSAAA